jgi:3-oxoacyl-[acyl-carrier-protein] synthase III
MIRAKITNFSYHLPTQTLDNDALAVLYPTWTADKILEKTGVRRRHIAGTDETASDLAFHAAQGLLETVEMSKDSIDFLIFCSQTSDYFLPSTSCVLQHRLGLPQTCGAVDVNQGCSGYVYCLGLAKGLIESRQARRVLILTADTYSKLIHPMDKSVRTLFGDAGSASVVEGVEAATDKILPCIFGTDGRGADKLIVATGAFREVRNASTSIVHEDQSGNRRARDNLYMDGADVLTFSLREVPRLVEQLLARSRMRLDEIDHFIFHQGSKLMLEMLRKKLRISAPKFVIDIEETGNTVSSTLPVALTQLFGHQRFADEKVVMLIGFGVGYSWAGTIAVI